MKLADHVVFTDFEYGFTQCYSTRDGNPRSIYVQPELLECIRLGWQALCPVEYDSKGKFLYRSRFGRSADTILKPLLEKRNFSIRKIIIDPGHGGNDPGVISPHGVSEKHLNLLLAQSVANELKKSGFEVTLTREKDVFIPLDKRVEDLDKNKFDLFISIHHNSSARPTASGLEIFLPEPQDENSCKRVSQTAYLAFALHKKLAPLNYFPGRGVKLARFKVLRLAKVPALLIEVGFLNHPMESAYLATAYFRKNFAAALTQEITAFASEQR